MAPKQPSSLSLGGRPVWVERELATRIKIPHTFVVHTYTRPTVCGYCKKLLKGIFKQGLQCKDCQYNTHKKCMDKIPKDCTGENLRDNIGRTNILIRHKDIFFVDLYSQVTNLKSRFRRRVSRQRRWQRARNQM